MNKGQETINTIQDIHNAIQDSNQDTLRALLDLEGLDQLPDNSVLKDLYDYLILHYNYIASALDDIDRIDQSVIYEES